MPVDPNHEPVKRAVYLTDREWLLVVEKLAERLPWFNGETERDEEGEQLAKEIEKQLGRSS